MSKLYYTNRGLLICSRGGKKMSSCCIFTFMDHKISVSDVYKTSQPACGLSSSSSSLDISFVSSSYSDIS